MAYAPTVHLALLCENKFFPLFSLWVDTISEQIQKYWKNNFWLILAWVAKIFYFLKKGRVKLNYSKKWQIGNSKDHTAWLPELERFLRTEYIFVLRGGSNDAVDLFQYR